MMSGTRKGTDSGLVSFSGTGESAVLIVFRGGLQEEPSYESWKDDSRSARIK